MDTYGYLGYLAEFKGTFSKFATKIRTISWEYRGMILQT